MAAECETLRELAEELTCQADNFRPDLLPSSLRTLPERLQTGRLTLAVLGQFKRGKSTLINALLGAKILPSSVLPLTSVLTRASYGEKPHLLVRFSDGREESHPVESLPEFVTEQGNPENVKGVLWADVKWPCDFLRRPVQIVDTPGVGSVYNHNTETSEAFLDHLDAAVFVLGVDPVLTQTEMEWLLKAKNQGERFFFVLNKVDQLTQSEVEQVLNFAHARLNDMWGNPGRIYPVSAKNALVSGRDEGFSNFRRELTAFLDNEAESTLFRSARRKMERGIKEILAIIALEKNAAGQPVEKLRSLLENLNNEEKKLTMERTKASYVMDETHRRLLAELAGMLDKHWEEVREDVRKDIETAWKGSSTVGAANKAMKNALEKNFEAMFAGFEQKAEKACASHFQQAVEFLVGEYREVADRIVKNTADVVDIALPDVELEIPEFRKSHFYVLVSSEMEGISSGWGSLINYLLPRSWGGFFVKRAFLNKLDKFYKMQKTRLLNDISYRFEERCRGVVSALVETTQQFLHRLKVAIEKGLALRERSEVEREAVFEDLQNREATFGNLLERVT